MERIDKLMGHLQQKSLIGTETRAGVKKLGLAAESTPIRDVRIIEDTMIFFIPLKSVKEPAANMVNVLR
jgi:hypothetical protein